MMTRQYQRALVTGGAGFIGSHLTDALVRAGTHVTVLDNLQAGAWSNLDGLHVAHIEGDVRDPRAVVEAVRSARPDVVFHLAANASVPASVEDPRYDFETNCGGTFHVLDALRQHAREARFVLASSAAVYGEPGAVKMVETSPVRPISPYGASKAAAEQQARMFQTVYGVDAVIVRIFNTYGPRMARFVVLDFLRKLQKDDRVLEILGTGRQVRDFTYVSDTVEGLLVAASRGAGGEVYNLATGTSHSVTDLATMLLRVVGLDGRTRLTFTGASWVGDAQHWEVDVAKLRSIAYEPRVSLEQGLAEVIEWFAGPRLSRGNA
jgi:UDP-glucose 4-epimerase